MSIADIIKPTMRPERYRRKRDGMIVVAGDWPDGDVSWMLENPPLIGSYLAGTCKRATFERNHEKVEA